MAGPNILDIARKAGVGKSTVARVLSGEGPVSADARERVLDAAQALKYRTNQAARSLRKGENRLLGVVVPDSASVGFLSHHVGAQKMEGAARGAKRLGYDLQIFIEDLGDAWSLRRLATEKSVRGFLFFGGVERPVLDMLKQYGIPWSSVNWCYPDRPRDPHCWTDFAHAGRTLISHLIARGCKRILAFDWLTPDYGPFDRGIRDGWSAHGLPERNLELYTDRHFGWGPEANALLERALDGKRRPDGLLLSREEAARDAYKLLRARGLEPGVDVAVATFDDLEIARNLEPQCTSYRQPFVEMAATAIEELDRVLTHGAEAAPICRNVPGELLVRASSQNFSARKEEV